MNQPSAETSSKPIQYTLKHLLLLAAGVAVVCALARIFGVVVVFIAISLTGPIATILALTHAARDSFSAMVAGVIASTLAFGIVGLGIEAIVFVEPTPGLIFSEHSLLFWMTAPIAFAYLGTLAGLVTSFHTILLWFAVIQARQWLGSQSRTAVRE